jgi:prepilin-type processing-associated H-X9-DG protein
MAFRCPRNSIRISARSPDNRGLKDGNNAAFCDGSVRFLISKIRLDVSKALVGRNDGIVVPADFDHD